MESDPPSLLPPPPPSSVPPQPGSAAYRSSSAPTTSVAPPALPPGLFWPCARALLACVMLVLRGLASANSGSTVSYALADVARATAIALCIAGLSLIVPRFRSFRAFTWPFMIVCFVDLYSSMNRLVD